MRGYWWGGGTEGSEAAGRAGVWLTSLQLFNLFRIIIKFDRLLTVVLLHVYNIGYKIIACILLFCVLLTSVQQHATVYQASILYNLTKSVVIGLSQVSHKL